MRVHTTKPVSAATRIRSDFIPLWGIQSQSVLVHQIYRLFSLVRACSWDVVPLRLCNGLGS